MCAAGGGTHPGGTHPGYLVLYKHCVLFCTTHYRDEKDHIKNLKKRKKNHGIFSVRRGGYPARGPGVKSGAGPGAGPAVRGLGSGLVVKNYKRFRIENVAHKVKNEFE